MRTTSDVVKVYWEGWGIFILAIGQNKRKLLIILQEFLEFENVEEIGTARDKACLLQDLVSPLLKPCFPKIAVTYKVIDIFFIVTTILIKVHQVIGEFGGDTGLFTIWTCYRDIITGSCGEKIHIHNYISF